MWLQQLQQVNCHSSPSCRQGPAKNKIQMKEFREKDKGKRIKIIGHSFRNRVQIFYQFLQLQKGRLKLNKLQSRAEVLIMTFSHTEKYKMPIRESVSLQRSEPSIWLIACETRAYTISIQRSHAKTCNAWDVQSR